ncbi:RrF2 family transcriptional regulator [Desulfopila inferna]|uniref:RrF2 family transcriptional regulator n=1 Tax=Desulfopila inferna TaxID=468528 RepID=UPI001964F6E7|nr:Rrf2 family transcriptional regulator [Desulfopila inferna]MBM9603617.1 Rrf2 family transcriptional regulator [Desulfopila inferna]
MSASTKLSNSVKALCFLAVNLPEPQSSKTISDNTGVNASKLRKLLADLAKINIVTTTKGASGGYLLARPPAQIHLQEIYCAIEDRKAFHLDVTALPQAKLDDALAVNSYFLDLFSEIQVEIEKKMSNITLESVLEAVSKN